MEKSFLKFAFIMLISVFTLSSCSKDENQVEPLRVEFENLPDEEVSATLTGNTAIIDGVARKEYLVAIEKSDVLTVPSIIRESQIEKTVLYPGSILQGKSFLSGNYDPLVLSNPFKEVDLFLTIKSGTGGQIYETVYPKGSSVFEGLNSLLVKGGNHNRFPLDYVPANYKYESEEINNEESFIKSTKVHAKANFARIVSASFGYTNTSASFSSKKYVMIKLAQTIYSAGIDPKHRDSWIDGNIANSEIGEYEPLYISSVDYGRLAYILIETTTNTKDVQKMVEGAVGFSIGKIGGSVNSSYNTQLQKLFSESKVTVSVLGGSSSNLITDFDSFMKYLKLENTADNLIVSSAPIGYTVRRLNDNTVVEIVNRYKETLREYR